MLVLLFVVLLAAIIVEFSYDAQVDASLAMNQGSDFEAYLAAKSAVAEGMALLREDVNPETLLNNQQQTPGLDGGATDLHYDAGRPDLTSERWAIGLPFEPQNEATRRVTISDEYGKINLNALLRYDPATDQLVANEPLIESLRYFFDSMIEAAEADTETDVLVDSIIDWLDYNDDGETEPSGAENDYYQGLENPYSCKNGPMDSIEELLLIQGMTPELYYGNAEVDPPVFPMTEYLTVHGAPNGAVNINSAQYEVFVAIAETWNAAQAPYSVPPDLWDVPNFQWNQLQQQMQRRNDPQQAQVSPPFISWSNAFRIYGDGLHDDTMVRIEAYVWRRPYDGEMPDRMTLTWTEDQLANMEQLTNQGGGSNANGMVLEEIEQFRVLDWRVIR